MELPDFLSLGKVVAVDGDSGAMRVDIDCDTAACAGCAIAGVCGGSKGERREIVAYKGDADYHPAVGDSVAIKDSRANRLIWWTVLAGIPCFSIALGMFIGIYFGFGEVAGAVVSLLIMALAYCGVYLIDKHFRIARRWLAYPVDRPA